MTILGIETTCDETGVGIVRDGREVLANVVASSASMHKKFGGIVPEIAAREQVKVIIPTLREALSLAQCKLLDIDAIAVANGPGLVGSLLIGVETAKTLALVFDKVLIAVNHLVGHVYANWITGVHPNFPLVALIVSGGHTDLILMKGHNDYKWLGGTLDDACGEAFDKVARVLGLGYPGGPEIEEVASYFLTRNSKLETRNVRFPRPMINEDNFDFSFSGLKTAVVNLVNSSPFLRQGSPRRFTQKGKQFTVHSIEGVAFEFQNAVVDVLVSKTIKAAKKFSAKSIVVGGGVAANSELRRRMSDIGEKNNLGVFFPRKNLSIDNGAMVAAAAFYDRKSVSPLYLRADPGLYFV